MRQSLLSISPRTLHALEQYAIRSSTAISPLLKQHFEWTQKTFADGDRSSSLPQAQWMMDLAKKVRPHRVLDIGCYTGLSAIAWHEGTAETEAMVRRPSSSIDPTVHRRPDKQTFPQIHTIEKDPVFARTARESFERLGCEKRVTVLEGTAQDM
ncbi:Uncharacterized protein TPAR_05378 [Tolypocladium paradoxum]|uniref:Uncharacterized protein n=1 Tax=Tolypocladium paradoxum TaxID=94208 RepID=A0A2S4KW90_9HYPO|nr:Uncharacterized protein TPAR_05378 [Tolypocladium paradoxum]